jgi:hypothetical protein
LKSLMCVIMAGIGAGWLVSTAHSQQRTQEPVDLGMISAIRDEGLSHSQVMDTVSWLADVYGPRLTGTPALRQAATVLM